MEVVADIQSRFFSDAVPEMASNMRNSSNTATPFNAPEYVAPTTTSTTNTPAPSQIPTSTMTSAQIASPLHASLTMDIADATVDMTTRIESTNASGGNILDFADGFSTSKRSTSSTKNENATSRSEITGAGTGDNAGKGDETDSNMDNKSQRKALPTPTKSEIVIRNRISAQRSNEKRRKKIEETRTQLNYLKLTYLPHLEKLQAMLKAENEQLKLKFMEKYQANDISSFY